MLTEDGKYSMVGIRGQARRVGLLTSSLDLALTILAVNTTMLRNGTQNKQ
jgi:hypothetical protein